MEASLEKADSLAATKPTEAAALYRQIALQEGAADADTLKWKETSVTKLAALLAKQGDALALRALLSEMRPMFAVIPKAKTAKLVRTIIDAVSTVPNTTDLQLSLCKELVSWTTQEKRTFLRHRVELRLAAIYLSIKDYSSALPLISALLTEVKRLDDKLLLVDIHLLESRVHHALRNLPKAKAALTAGRTAANAIYVPPGVQSQIDLQSGILHAEEKDYKTAFSYFFEAFEQMQSLEDPGTVAALKYMLLCKVMMASAEDVPGLINSKGGVKHQGPDLDAMRAIAAAATGRSLKALEEALQGYKAQLEDDPIIKAHLAALYDSLLEQNLTRLIEPYSRVETAHVAALIELPLDTVERKLSQMILDKKFAGTLDQGAGCLIVFGDVTPDATYTAALEAIAALDRVVDNLVTKSTKIVA